MSHTELGIFLKARRSHVGPGDVGLSVQPGRRVSGLRREEVAMLSGVSVDYYTRLEQGREKNPSPSVVNALSGALNLDDDQRGHVFRLAGLAPSPRQPIRDTINQSLRDLLASWSHTPAVVINRRLDILAHNDLAVALYSDFSRVDNFVRMTFVDPIGREFFSDWPHASESCVANLRLALGHSGTDEAVLALVKETHAISAEFRALWARNNVRGKTHESKKFHHSDVGDLLLDYNAFDVRGAPGQQLVVYQAAPGTANADKLELLGTLAATTLRGGSTNNPVR